MLKTIESIKPLGINGDYYRMIYEENDIDSPCSKCDLYNVCEELSDQKHSIYHMLCVEYGEEFKKETGKYPYFLKIKNYETKTIKKR